MIETLLGNDAVTIDQHIIKWIADAVKLETSAINSTDPLADIAASLEVEEAIMCLEENLGIEIPPDIQNARFRRRGERMVKDLIDLAVECYIPYFVRDEIATSVLGLETTKITNNVTFAELGLDRIDFGGVLLVAEKRFGISVTNKDQNDLYDTGGGTPGQLVDFIKSKLGLHLDRLRNVPVPNKVHERYMFRRPNILGFDPTTRHSHYAGNGRLSDLKLCLS